MSWTQTKQVIGVGLQAQRFRPVQTAELESAQLIAHASGTVLERALNGVAQNPDWIEVGTQLNQLRTRAYVSLYVRRDTSDLEMVPVYGWSGGLGLQTVEQHLDWVHSVTSRLSGALGRFTLSPPVEEVISKGIASTPPLLQSLASVVLDLNKSRMPNTTMLAVDSDGLSTEIRERFNTAGVYRSSANPLTLNRPLTYAAVVDGASLSVHGHNDWFSLDLPELSRSLPFLYQNL
ncbi:hypothetical protein AB4Z55_18145 [Gordonia sp. ABKF26]